MTEPKLEAVRISACVVCRDEADKLGDCLASLAWADEILVMDLQSSDGSGDVARAAGARVFSRAPHPVVEPLRDELAAHATGTWVLAVDPDERVRPGLAAALRELARRDDLDAVVLPRMNVDFGWAPQDVRQRYEPQLRMYRRAAVSWPHFPNRLPTVATERTGRVPGRDDLVLEHLRNRSVAETAERLVRYPTAQAEAMLEEGRVFTAAAMMDSLGKHARKYVVDSRCWEEGVPGLVRAAVLLSHHVYTWIALWQLTGAPRTDADDAVVRRLGRVVQGLAALQASARLPGRASRKLAHIVGQARAWAR